MKYYGTATYNKEHNRFEIECEPHVSMRLKRVFGKLGDHSQGTHRISLNEENARDILWFIERYPLQIDRNDASILELYSEKHKETERFLQQFYTEHQYDKISAPLAHPAYDYQVEAATMLMRMKGLLLADELGTGKTVSFIASLTQRETLPAVVVPLAHLPGQWKDMLNYFAPHLRVHIVKTKTPYKVKPHDVYIVNYHKLSGWAETLAPIVKTVCFDEAQELRHNGSAKYSAAQHVTSQAEFRIGLSGTPIYNYGGEIFNVIDILSPGKLGTREEFYREWCTSIYGKMTLKDPATFGNFIRNNGLMLRRTRKEVGHEIPNLQLFTQTIDADQHAFDDIAESCTDLAQFILHGEETKRGQKMEASQEFDMRLRQATGIAKAPHVANFVRMLVDNGEKVLLFGWHRLVYEIWNRMLFDLNPVMYTGSESPKQKQDAKEEFINGNAQVMIMSNRAGAGTDGLQNICHVGVNGELDWSPGVHEQNIGRIWRAGQKEPVLFYRLISEHGSDPIIADILGIKRNQVEGIKNPNGPMLEKLQADPEHIKKLAQNYLDRGKRK